MPAVHVLGPPTNIAGVPLPPAPGNPPNASDVGNAAQYVTRLVVSTACGNVSTPDVVGQAELYKDTLCKAIAPHPAAAPQWAIDLQESIRQLGTRIGELEKKTEQLNTETRGEIKAQALALQNDLEETRGSIDNLAVHIDAIPVLFSNYVAGGVGLLHDPTTLADGIGSVMQPPNPKTRDELLKFTVTQCKTCATHLGLPALPAGVSVEERRRQIGNRLCVLNL